jgi:hypothetical protein
MITSNQSQIFRNNREEKLNKLINKYKIKSRLLLINGQVLRNPKNKSKTSMLQGIQNQKKSNN